MASSIRILGLVLLCCTGSAVAQQALIIDGESFRDPTRPPRVVAVQAQSNEISASRDFAVTFIRSGGDSSTAVINGTLVPLGGSIDGAIVRAIGTDSVTLEVEGQLVEVNAFRAGFRSSAN